MHPPFKSTERDPFVSEQYFSVGIHIQCLKRITFFFFFKQWSYENAFGSQGRLFFIECVSQIKVVSN